MICDFGIWLILTEEGRPNSRPKPTVEFNHAVQYVAKIKHRFRDQPLIYSDFLDILHDYQAKRTIDEVYQRVQKLFGDQPDLLEEFKYFLPGEGPTPVKQDKTTKEKKADKMKPKGHKEKGRYDQKGQSQQSGASRQQCIKIRSPRRYRVHHVAANERSDSNRDSGNDTVGARDLRQAHTLFANEVRRHPAQQAINEHRRKSCRAGGQHEPG